MASRRSSRSAVSTRAIRWVVSMSTQTPSMNPAVGLAARIGSVIERYSTVPTALAASIGVNTK